MKTIYQRMLTLITVLTLSGLCMSATAQQMSATYTSISGVVKDAKSKKRLEYVSISVPGTNISTITNADGVFVIKFDNTENRKTIELSHIGYKNTAYPIRGNQGEEIVIYMDPAVKQLKDVVVESVNAEELVENAIKKVETNYSPKANILTGFYRETIKKRRNYITISEAILDIYKSPYSQSNDKDRVQVYKGRKLISPKPNDTLIVKYQGGPNLSTLLDVVKNPDLFLNAATLSYYKFNLIESVTIDERPHYAISFEPQVIVPYALHHGILYIDKQSLTFSRAEFSLNMDDKNKATEAILRKKPLRMHFKPEEVSFIVNYKQQDGISYLDYVRSEVRFKCDWKRRLFSTGYTIVSEMVVTDRQEDNVTNIPRKLVFNPHHSLSDKVQNFQDPQFWEDYNIIEPTESLENAVNKLKKQYNK